MKNRSRGVRKERRDARGWFDSAVAVPTVGKLLTALERSMVSPEGIVPARDEHSESRRA